MEPRASRRARLVSLGRGRLLGFILAISISRGVAAQQVVPFEFDPARPEEPALVQERLNALLARLPVGYVMPLEWVDVLSSGPDGVTDSPITLWLFHEAKAQMLRNAQAGPEALVWPKVTLCALSSTFDIAAEAPAVSASTPACTALAARVQASLAREVLDACVGLELPERYVLAARVPDGLDDAQRTQFVREHSATFLDQIALAGAGFATTSPDKGLLPDDFVSRLRGVLWKVRVEPLEAARRSQAEIADLLVALEGSAAAACFEPSALTAVMGRARQLLHEFDAMIAQVTTVVRAGEERAALQTQCLEAAGRERPPLPYPALTDEDREFVGFWLGAVYWRMRGAALIRLDGTTSYRTIYAQRSLREIVRLANGTDVGQHAADALVCNLLDGWGEWFDMGTNQSPDGSDEATQDAYYDLVQLTNRGRQQVADFPYQSLPCGWLMGVDRAPTRYLEDAGFDSRALVAAGLSMGACYLYALNPLKGFRYYSPAEAQPPYMYFIDVFTSTGEVCFGGSLGLGLTRAFLGGVPTGSPVSTLCGDRVCGSDACGNSCGTCEGTEHCDTDGRCAGPLAEGDPQPPDGGDEAGGIGGDSERTDAPPLPFGRGPASSQTGCQCGSAGAGLALPSLGILTRRWRRNRGRAARSALLWALLLIGGLGCRPANPQRET